MAQTITTADELEARVAEGVVVLKCFTKQCLRCPAVSDLLVRLQSTHKFEIAPCDVHNIEESLFEVLQVTQLPTLLIFNDGVEVARGAGIYEANEIKILINRHCKVQMVTDEDF